MLKKQMNVFSFKRTATLLKQALCRHQSAKSAFPYNPFSSLFVREFYKLK